MHIHLTHVGLPPGPSKGSPNTPSKGSDEDSGKGSDVDSGKGSDEDSGKGGKGSDEDSGKGGKGSKGSDDDDSGSGKVARISVYVILMTCLLTYYSLLLIMCTHMKSQRTLKADQGAQAVQKANPKKEKARSQNPSLGNLVKTTVEVETVRAAKEEREDPKTKARTMARVEKDLTKTMRRARVERASLPVARLKVVLKTTTKVRTRSREARVPMKTPAKVERVAKDLTMKILVQVKWLV